jgi:hypothetical protein
VDFEDDGDHAGSPVSAAGTAVTGKVGEGVG